jgi:hypothetical protein
VTRPSRAPLLAALGLLGLLLVARMLAAQPAPSAPGSDGRPTAPPALGQRLDLPLLPPEYLQHDVGGIRFAYHPSARDRVRPLIEMTEELRSALRRELGAPVLARAEVRVAMGSADLGRITPTAAGGARGSFGELELLVIDLGAPPGGDPADARETFCRGLAQLAIGELAAGHALPRWLEQGFALRFADRPTPGGTLALGWAALRGRLVPFAQLDDGLGGFEADDSLRATEAADVVRFLLDGERGQRFPDLVRRLAHGERSAAALEAAYGIEPGLMERAWRADLARRAVFAPVLGGALALGALLTAGGALGRRVHRRRLARRRELDELRQLGQRLTRAAPEMRVRLIQLRSSDLEGRAPAPDMPLGEPPSEGVPKVSHDGRWHTLH